MQSSEKPLSVPESAFTNPSSRALTIAAINGDETALRTAIAAGGDVNELGAEKAKCSPLCWAVRSKRLDAVELLLKNGANPNQVLGSVWQSPIHAAVIDHAPIPILETLLSHGGDANLDGGLDPAIEVAALDNNPEAFEVLYKHGAKLFWNQPVGSDLLITSILGDNIQTFRFLLKHNYCTGYPYAAQHLGVSPNPPPNLVTNLGPPPQPDPQAAANSAKTQQLLNEFRQAAIEAASTCKNEHDSRVDKNKPKSTK